MDRTCEEFAKFSKKDGDAYAGMMTEYEEMKPLFAARPIPGRFRKPLRRAAAGTPEGKDLAAAGWRCPRGNYSGEF